MLNISSYVSASDSGQCEIYKKLVLTLLLKVRFLYIKEYLSTDADYVIFYDYIRHVRYAF